MLARLVTSAISRENVEWMFSGPDTPIGRKHPHTGSVMKCVEENSIVVEQQQTSRRWS